MRAHLRASGVPGRASACTPRRAAPGTRTARSYTRCVARAAIVTVGNELVSGDVENTNGSWLARRLGGLGVEVCLIAVLPDDVEQVAAFVRAQATVAHIVIVTGGVRGRPGGPTPGADAAGGGGA